MTNKIIDGDYVKSNGAARLQTVDYIDEVLQNAKIILTAHRGEFYPNKDFGSLISTINARLRESGNGRRKRDYIYNRC